MDSHISAVHKYMNWIIFLNSQFNKGFLIFFSELPENMTILTVV